MVVIVLTEPLIDGAGDSGCRINPLATSPVSDTVSEHLPSSPTSHHDNATGRDHPPCAVSENPQVSHKSLYFSIFITWYVIDELPLFLLTLVKLCLPYNNHALILTVITLFTFLDCWRSDMMKSNRQYFYKLIEVQVVYCQIGAVFYMNYYIY